MPMFSAEFLSTVDREQLAVCIELAQDFGKPSNDDTARLGADLLLRAAYTVLKDDQQREEAAKRITANPRSKELLNEEMLAEWLE
jgi:hypothetical protein